jgi:PTS system fructose-specific IIA component/PTS system nitrogen regulatory IIA component
MRMSDFVIRDAIVPNLQQSTKEGIVREIVESLRTAGYFPGNESEAVVKAILKREQLGSTGIGRSIAIPHGKSTAVDRLIGTVAISPIGANFESIDGELVHLFVLLVSPQDRPGDHLRALESVVRTMKNDDYVKALREAQSRDAIWKLLDEPPS